MGLRTHLSQAFLSPARAFLAHLSRTLGAEAFLLPETDSGNHNKFGAETNLAGQALSAWEWDWIDLGSEG
jgi:hypothetical protein